MNTSTPKLTPRTATSFKQVCALDRSALDMAGFWILVEEGQVTLTAQRSGESPTAKITIPRRQFNVMVDFYNGR